MGRAILRDTESGEAFRVFFDNGRIAQTMRNFPPSRYELLALDAMRPLGVNDVHRNITATHVIRGVKSSKHETARMVALIALVILVMGIVGGIERGTLPV